MDVSGTIDAIVSQKGSHVWTISPEATVFDAIQLMADENIGALLVVNAGGGLLGVISERDYTRKVMLRGKRSKETQVREIMTTEPTTVSPSESVEHCLRLMTDQRVRHLPVLEANGRICGVISIGDLVKSIISRQAAVIEQLESYITGGYPG
ncbi:MAG: CBS domain-containing protein [Verrucomicrobia bacterium]|nr:CBS domain-containing protein [Verrucomicrobiota bacterium]